MLYPIMTSSRMLMDLSGSWDFKLDDGTGLANKWYEKPLKEPLSIRVNAIAPGFFSTAQNAKLLWNEDGTPTARTGKILAATPMGRFGESAELSGALLFLLNNDAAGFITGVTLPVDGGFSAYSGV